MSFLRVNTDIPVLTFELSCDANEPSINSKDTNEINKNLRIDADLMLFVCFDLVVMKCEMCHNHTINFHTN